MEPDGAVLVPGVIVWATVGTAVVGLGGSVGQLPRQYNVGVKIPVGTAVGPGGGCVGAFVAVGSGEGATVGEGVTPMALATLILPFCQEAPVPLILSAVA